MATAYPLPDATQVAHLLGLLFDGLAVKAGGIFDRSIGGGAWFGVFIADDGSPAALCGVDMSLAASFGAAFSMLPANSVKEAAKARELSPMMLENLREIMNICTRLVMDNTSPHLKLGQLVPVKALLPPALALLDAPRGQREFVLTLPKYGGGVMSLLST